MHFINLLKPAPIINAAWLGYREQNDDEAHLRACIEETELQEEEQLASDIDAASDFISEHHMGERGAYAFDPCASCEAAHRDIALATKRLDALRQQRGDLEEECTEPPDRDHPGDVYF